MGLEKQDAIFSKYIRLKYANKHGMVRCYTCPSLLFWKYIQNGHYITRSNMATRFSEDNCRPQCPTCNQDCNAGGKTLTLFGDKLRLELGDDKVDGLLLAKRSVFKYTRTELNELTSFYADKVSAFLKELQLPPHYQS